MKVTDKILAKINRIDTGYLFGYDRLEINSDEIIAASKALSRLVEKGIIKRARKGYYYKPKVTVFGELRPREEVLLSIYLFEKKKQVAYVTGAQLYNRLGLTTQVPNAIRVASFEKQIKGKVGNTIIKPAKSYVMVTSDNIKYLEILDVIKDFNKIPDLNKSNGIVYLKKVLYDFDELELTQLVTYGMAYPPKVRALLGALLEALKIDFSIYDVLKKSINALSSYRYGINSQLLSTTTSWNII